MEQPKTIKIDNVEYVRSDSIKPVEMGEKQIIVADRGWVFVGDCVNLESGGVEIHNAKNIRRWGTTRGLGELANGPTEKTKFDEYGLVVVADPIARIAVTGGW